MGALFLDEVGLLDGNAEILDVGAGSEEILFWLAHRAKRVVATDIYGRGPWSNTVASTSFLEDPTTGAPYPYPEDRLEVRDMDARALDFPDASFDAVVSFSSIEHFGSPADIARSASEIGRVLRRGGYAFLVTEVFVHHHLLDRAPPQFAVRMATFGRRCGSATLRRHALGDVFRAHDVIEQVVAPSGLELMQDLQIAVSPQAYDNVQRVVAENVIASASGEPFPNILMQSHWSTFTSLGLPLHKTA